MGTNTYTKGYSNGAALTEAQLDTAYQTLNLDVSNTALMTTGSTDGQVLTSTGSGLAAAFETIPDPQGPFALRNYGLKATVAAGVMTITLTTKAGTAPSGSDKVDFNYSTNGTTSAVYSSVQVSNATTLSINASATLGAASTSTVRIYTYGYYNTVTTSVKLAVSSRSDLDQGAGVAMVSLSASADSGSVLYASAVLTVVPRLLGWINATHTSAGAWQTPSKVNISNNSPTSPFEQSRARTSSAGRIGQVVVSGSCGNFSATGSFTDITNLSISIMTTGRPVYLGLRPDGTGSSAYIQIGGAAPCEAEVKFVRDGATTTGPESIAGAASGLNVPASGISTIDFPSAGTYTYTLQVKALFGACTVNNLIMYAYEL